MSVPTEIAGKIRGLLQEDEEIAAKLTADVKDDDPLLELGVVDSFQLIDVIARLEETFDISIGPEELDRDNFGSISSMAGLVARKTSVADAPETS